MLATGGHVDPPPAEFANVPVIEKPYTVDRVTPALEAAFASDERDFQSRTRSFMGVLMRLALAFSLSAQVVSIMNWSQDDIIFPVHAVGSSAALRPARRGSGRDPGRGDVARRAHHRRPTPAR